MLEQSKVDSMETFVLLKLVNTLCINIRKKQTVILNVLRLIQMKITSIT